MKIKSITVYTIVIAAVFALAILFFSCAVIREYQGGSNRTGAIFDHMVTGTKNAASTYQSNSAEFRATFEQLTGTLENYDSLVLAKNNLPIFVYPAGAIETTTSGKFYKAYSNSFSVSGESYKITATMYLLRPSSIFHYARFSFFIVLVGTALAVILLCYLYVSKSDAVEIEEPAKDDNIKNEDVYSNFLADFNTVPKATTVVNEPETAATSNVSEEQPKTTVVPNIPEDKSETTDVQETTPVAEQKPETMEETNVVEESVAEESTFDNAVGIVSEDTVEETVVEPSPFFDEPVSEEEAFAKNDVFETHEENVEEESVSSSSVDNNSATNIETPSFDSAPNGIFSPATGFCWEDHLEPRLDTELIRATASETDLSLILIRVPGLIFSEPLTKVICTYLQQQFQYSDLLFEYMPDGFAVIKEDMSIDAALSLAETVLAEIDKIIAGKGYNCYIGISTRAERILPGKRILLEASEALKHAIASGSESPIIAFKANDTKYREYIETHS